MCSMCMQVPITTGKILDPLEIRVVDDCKDSVVLAIEPLGPLQE